MSGIEMMAGECLITKVMECVDVFLNSGKATGKKKKKQAAHEYGSGSPKVKRDLMRN